MKKFLLYFICLLAFPMMAQRKASTPPMKFEMDASRLRARIDFIPGTLEFHDVDNDSTIGANEHCTIRFQVRSVGEGDGVGCIARISAEGNTRGLSYRDVDLPTIKHGDLMWVEFPIKSDTTTETGMVHFKMEVYEPNGMGTGDITLDVPTYHFVSPMIKVTDYRILGDKSTLQRKEKFTLQILVKNVDQGIANDVGVKISIPEGITFADDSNVSFRIDQLLGNEEKIIEYEMFPTAKAPNKMDILIDLSEKYRQYAEDRLITLHVDERLFSYSEKIKPTKFDTTISGGKLSSIVDTEIPRTNKNNLNTYAVIIANEKYQNVANVPFAMNDGRIFKEYCIKTLGIPGDQISFRENATVNNIAEDVEWLQNVCRDNKDIDIIFYYTGHGVPDVSNRYAYLLPVDGSATNTNTGYKLDNLYAALGSVPAKTVTIFIDACFSGTTRGDGKEMLVSAKGVAIKARSSMPQGNMVVFSAAQGDQTAYPFYKEQHGRFTYFLLEKLQETKGDVTLHELFEHIYQGVRATGSKERTPQIPCVTASPIVGDAWKTWRLK